MGGTKAMRRVRWGRESQVVAVNGKTCQLIAPSFHGNAEAFPTHSGLLLSCEPRPLPLLPPFFFSVCFFVVSPSSVLRFYWLAHISLFFGRFSFGSRLSSFPFLLCTCSSDHHSGGTSGSFNMDDM